MNSVVVMRHDWLSVDPGFKSRLILATLRVDGRLRPISGRTSQWNNWTNRPRRRATIRPPETKPSTLAHPAFISRPSHQKNAGTTGPNSTRKPGHNARNVTTRSFPPPVSTANQRAACSPTSTKSLAQVQKFEGNPEHPGSRGRNCAKGPATLNQVTDPDRILYPLKRAGKRGEGKWERTTWDEALDTIAARIRKAIVEERRNEIMYHVGRPGEDGFTERILAAWGVDGHNSHTNICSSGSREGYQLWMGLDRPSPDHANAKVILLISAHLESGHYFNPHAQRVIDGKANGAKLIVFDTRLSSTATHADYWVAPYPGSEAAMLLAIANYLIQNNLYNREFVETLVELERVFEFRVSSFRVSSFRISSRN